MPCHMNMNVKPINEGIKSRKSLYMYGLLNYLICVLKG